MYPTLLIMRIRIEELQSDSFAVAARKIVFTSPIRNVKRMRLLTSCMDSTLYLKLGLAKWRSSSWSKREKDSIYLRH